MVDAVNPDGSDIESPANVAVFRVRVPLLRSQHSAHHDLIDRESILVRWQRTDGHVGWGECPTLPTPGYATETTAEAWSWLIGPALGSLSETGSIPDSPARPAALGAIRDAALDARLRSESISAAALFGEREQVPTTAVVALAGGVIDEVVDRAVALAADASALKLKVVPDSALEVARAVLDAVGPIPVALDANGSFDPDPTAVDAERLASLLALPLAYIEQPYPPRAPLERWRSLAVAGDVPLAVDESATSIDEVRTALRSGACSIVSIKPARLGGVLAASAVADAVVEEGGTCFVGGMFELGVGRSTALRLAASGSCRLPTDVGPTARYVEEDITEAVGSTGDGGVWVPVGPGLASAPDPERLRRWTVDHAATDRRRPD